MGQEKLEATVESVRATVTGVAKANAQTLRVLAGPPGRGPASGCTGTAERLLASWLEIPGLSLAPFHRRVMANKRRLSGP